MELLNNLPLSFDAVNWAKAFVCIVEQTPNIATDEEAMTTWFANALMAGFDESERRIRNSDRPNQI